MVTTSRTKDRVAVISDISGLLIHVVNVLGREDFKLVGFCTVLKFQLKLLMSVAQSDITHL